MKLGWRRSRETSESSTMSQVEQFQKAADRTRELATRAKLIMQQAQDGSQSISVHPYFLHALSTQHVSFVDLVNVWWAVDDPSLTSTVREQYLQLLPETLRVFELTHGPIDYWYQRPGLNSFVMRTAGTNGDRFQRRDASKRSRYPDFHFVYSLTAIPVGGPVLTRIEMLAANATHMLQGSRLVDCLDQLYSKTTDALGIIWEAAKETQLSRTTTKVAPHDHSTGEIATVGELASNRPAQVNQHPDREAGQPPAAQEPPSTPGSSTIPPATSYAPDTSASASPGSEPNRALDPTVGESPSDQPSETNQLRKDPSSQPPVTQEGPALAASSRPPADPMSNAPATPSAPDSSTSVPPALEPKGGAAEVAAQAPPAPSTLTSAPISVAPTTQAALSDGSTVKHQIANPPTADMSRVQPAAVSGFPHQERNRREDLLKIIDANLDDIEFVYLTRTARLTYFEGALVGMLLVMALVGIGWLISSQVHEIADLGRGFVLALLFGAIGAFLSVAQRISSGSLVVRYDLGRQYTALLGGLRPFIGAFGGVLVWLLLQAKILANVTNSDFYVALLAFATGIAERSLGDVVTETGILGRLSANGAGVGGKGAPPSGGDGKSA